MKYRKKNMKFRSDFQIRQVFMHFAIIHLNFDNIQFKNEELEEKTISFSS